MRKIIRTNLFEKDVKRVSKRGCDLNILFAVIESLVNTGKLDKKFKAHKLTGNWVGFYECHLKPDWLLIYLVEDDAITLVRTGSHSDLFS